MSADLQALQAIHRIESEIDESVKAVKALLEQRSGMIEDSDEYKALEEALAWILHAFEGVAACEIAKVPVLQGQ